MARLKILIALFLIFVSVDCKNESVEDEDSRRHYGISFNNKCGNYAKVFKCMTACKSVGYQVFRLNHRCKCTCHEMKTTTILPFFKWKTNGTTRTVPRTFSIQLYHIVGTLSPTPYHTMETMNTTLSTCPTFPTTNASITVDSNGTSNGVNGTGDDSNGTSDDANGTANDVNGTSDDAHSIGDTNGTDVNGTAGNESPSNGIDGASNGSDVISSDDKDSNATGDTDSTTTAPEGGGEAPPAE